MEIMIQIKFLFYDDSVYDLSKFLKGQMIFRT